MTGTGPAASDSQPSGAAVSGQLPFDVSMHIAISFKVLCGSVLMLRAKLQLYGRGW
jgi:hypothetical protein